LNQSRRSNQRIRNRGGLNAAMAKSMAPISAFALALPLLCAGCAGSEAQPRPLDRPSQAPLIIEEVLRYQIHQFAKKEGEPEGALCVAVREGSMPRDPSPELVLRLGNKRVQPQSSCSGARTLIAGPVEWLRDDEVRVGGGYVRASEGETRLAYRVVRENGRWVCVGPIISWDPL
jgi:hypothetical protein